MSKNLDDNNPEFIVLKPISKIKMVIGLISIFSSVIFGYYYYEYKYLPKQEIEIITADEGFSRIKPEKPGGHLVPNTDKLVYNNLKPGKNTENTVLIMPDPEEPIKIVQKNNPSDEDNNKIDDIILNILSNSKNTGTQEQNNIEDISSEQPVINNGIDETNIASLEQNNGVETKKHQDEVPISHTKSLNIIQLDEGAKHRKKSSAPNKSYYRLQLASVRTEASAIQELNRLQKIYPKQLGSLTHKVDKVTLENKGVFYRLLIGQFPSFSKAKALCKKMNHTNQSCIIINN